MTTTMPPPPRSRYLRATGTTARSSKVYDGSLKLGGATAQVDFSCLPTAVAINPPDPPDDSDTGEVLCGDPVEAESAGAAATYGTLTFTSLQDFDDPQGLVAYSWQHRGEYVPYEWVASPNGFTVTGTVRVWPLQIGGDVGRAVRLTVDAEWALGEDPVFSWQPTPPPNGAATGASAGMPGVWTPTGSTPPADLAALQAGGITASPTTPWATGQWVEPADGSMAYWDGSAWQQGNAPVYPATGATAGTPGTWTPSGSAPPADLATLQSGSITATPTTHWGLGQWVNVGDYTMAHWDGTAWQQGQAPEPPVTGATAGSPGTWTPTGALPPADLTALQSGSIAADPATAWTTGQYVVLADSSNAYWDGTAWQQGQAA
jgi:hypothetical protein